MNWVVSVLEVKTFYKTQGEVAEILIKLIDSYWADTIKEDTLIDLIKRINQNNEHLLYKGSEFTSVVKMRCGKKRLELVSRILNVAN